MKPKAQNSIKKTVFKMHKITHNQKKKKQPE